MDEILPGVFHWTARHPRIGVAVSSHWLADGAVAIDPVTVPGRDTAAVLLSNRHHYRVAAEIGCPVYASRPGMHEFDGGGREVQPFDFGDTLPGGVLAVEMGGICPDDTAFLLAGGNAILFADAIVGAEMHGGELELGFVPDGLMDEPEQTKAAILERLRAILAEHDFEHVLLAHGRPRIGDGRAQLQAFVDEGGRTAFEL